MSECGVVMIGACEEVRNKRECLPAAGAKRRRGSSTGKRKRRGHVVKK